MIYILYITKARDERLEYSDALCIRYAIVLMKTKNNLSLKTVYQVNIKEADLELLDKLEGKWCKKYPIAFKSWCGKWENLTHYFKY